MLAEIDCVCVIFLGRWLMTIMTMKNDAEK